MDKNLSIKRKEDYIIREANNLISASYRFNIWEDRIFYLALAQITPDDEDFKEYHIYIRDLANEFNIKTNRVYELIREAVVSLRRKTITIPYVFKDGKKGMLTTGILTSYGELDEENRSYIVVELHPKLKPYLLELKGEYTSINICYLMTVESSHSRRIYKLLKQYKSIGRRTFDLDDLKYVLCIGEDEYKRYYDLKRRLIQKAQKDLEQYTDLRFEFEEIRDTRKKVKSIVFFIYENEPERVKTLPLEERERKGLLPLKKKTKKTKTKKKEAEAQTNLFDQKEDEQGDSVAPLTKEEQEIFDVVAKWGITKVSFHTYLKKYGLPHIIKATDYTLKKPDVRDRAAYFARMVGLEFKDPKDQKKKAQDEKLQQKKRKNRLDQLEKVYKNKKDLIDKWRHNERISIVTQLLQNDPHAETELLKLCREYASRLLNKEYDSNKSLIENYQEHNSVRYAVNIGVDNGKKELYKSVDALYQEKIHELDSWYEEQKNKI